MSNYQQGQNDAQQNKGQQNTNGWSDKDKKDYQAGWHSGKK